MSLREEEAGAGAMWEAPVPVSPVVVEGDADVALNALRRLVQALRSMGIRSQRDFGVTPAQLFVLRRIAAHPGVSMSELARYTLTRESSVSEVVSRLVASGYVSRRPAATDRRRAELRLAPAGQRVIALAAETVQERLVGSFQRLPDEIRGGLARGLAAWVAAAGLDEAPATMFLEPEARP